MHHRWAEAAVCSTAFVFLAGCHHHQTLRSSIVRSNFIFEATVQQVSGTTLPDYVRADLQTLVVHVTRAFTAEFQEFVGQTVTVGLLPGSPVKTQSARV